MASWAIVENDWLRNNKNKNMLMIIIIMLVWKGYQEWFSNEAVHNGPIASNSFPQQLAGNNKLPSTFYIYTTK